MISRDYASVGTTNHPRTRPDPVPSSLVIVVSVLVHGKDRISCRAMVEGVKSQAGSNDGIDWPGTPLKVAQFTLEIEIPTFTTSPTDNVPPACGRLHMTGRLSQGPHKNRTSIRVVLDQISHHMFSGDGQGLRAHLPSQTSSNHSLTVSLYISGMEKSSSFAT